MKKAASKKRSRARRGADEDIRPEYDFSKGRPNPYAAPFQAGVTMVTLDPDVAESFPDSAAVNDALRALVRIANRPASKSRSKRRTA